MSSSPTLLGASNKTSLLCDVPVVASRFGGSSIIICPKIGDLVLVGVIQHERDVFLTSCGDVKTNLYRQFSLNDAVVFTGIFTTTTKNDTRPNPTDLLEGGRSYTTCLRLEHQVSERRHD